MKVKLISHIKSFRFQHVKDLHLINFTQNKQDLKGTLGVIGTKFLNKTNFIDLMHQKRLFYMIFGVVYILEAFKSLLHQLSRCVLCNRSFYVKYKLVMD